MLSRQIAAAALILVLLFGSSIIPPEEAFAVAPTTGSPGQARAPGPNPDWVIVGETRYSGPRIIDANITIEQNGALTLENATIIIVQNSGALFAFRVKTGGSLIMSNSSIQATRFDVEPGADISLKDSQLNISGFVNVSGNFSILDSEINVTGPAGSSPSGSGEPATLILGGDYPGVIRRSTVLVAGGEGAKGADGHGTTGGAGGNASLTIIADGFLQTNLTVRAGDGGKGGTPGTTTPHAGSGGRGGNVEVRLQGNRLTNSSLDVGSGNGGDGIDGSTTTGIDAGNGGEGGEGGSVDFGWTGYDLTVSMGSNISIMSGHGGGSGNGGLAQSSGKSGGNGGQGGSGGSAAAVIRSFGTLAASDSEIRVMSGKGSGGGIFGRAQAGGRDGFSGDGGDGGKSTLTVRCIDRFSAANTRLRVQAADGGNGGAGIIGGRGGEGGSSLLNLTVLDSRTQSRALLENSTLSSHGGNGGDGGKWLSVGRSQGQPGDGGRGGGAGLYIHCSDNLTVLYSHLRCDEGQRGAADPQAKPGHWGVGELYNDAVNVLMRKSSYSQTMGFVDNNDYWRLESTYMVRSNPPLKPPHFLPVAENGTVEEYWDPSVRVQDIMGNTITDVSVTVTVYNGSTLVASKRTDRYGLADFTLLFARYAARDSRLFMYTVNATDDSGAFAYPVSVPGTDASITLTLLSKSHPPLCAITNPDEHLTPVIDASQYLRSDGRVEMYIIQGKALDNPLNPMQDITAVEVKIGDDGPWIPASFVVATPNYHLWNLIWDIYNWSMAKLMQYPSGIIPCPIYARSYNDRFWSDDRGSGGSITIANITIRLLRIPPPPPEIVSMTAHPVVVDGRLGTQTSSGDTWFFRIPYGMTIHFEALVRANGELSIIRFVWCFDDSSGYHEDSSSPDCSTATVTYPIEKDGEYIEGVLKVFDNGSARRVELLRAGVSYDEFGYDFDSMDGSAVGKLRAYIACPSGDFGDDSDPTIPIFLSILTITIILAVLLAGHRQRRNRLLRESLGK